MVHYRCLAGRQEQEEKDKEEVRVHAVAGLWWSRWRKMEACWEGGRTKTGGCEPAQNPESSVCLQPGSDQRASLPLSFGPTTASFPVSCLTMGKRTDWEGWVPGGQPSWLAAS